MRYWFGGLILGGSYTWRGLFSEFYGMLRVLFLFWLKTFETRLICSLFLFVLMNVKLQQIFLKAIVFKTRETYFLNQYVYLPKIPRFHCFTWAETLDDDNDDVTITVCHCLFLLHSLKPEVNDNKSETIVSFSKESGKKVIDPG